MPTRNHRAHGVPMQADGMLVALLAFAVVALVIGPAIWSRRQFRRDAALAVLERLLRHR